MALNNEKLFTTDKEKNRLNSNYKYKFFNKDISIINEKIIKESRKDSNNKLELNYKFSYPYLINENKIFIINSIVYRNPETLEVKGGTERVIIYLYEDGLWKKAKTINLIDI